jgi:hypothetical protein
MKAISEKHFAIDPAKVEEEKRFDGICLLRTNTDLNPLEAMLCYKQLWDRPCSPRGFCACSLSARL